MPRMPRPAGVPNPFYRAGTTSTCIPHAENQAIFQRIVDTGEPYEVAAKPYVFPNQQEQGGDLLGLDPDLR